MDIAHGPGSDASVARLTSRQRDVLFLLCKGLHSSEIGLQLGVSEGAVKYHINHMLLIFDVTNRTELVGRFALEVVGPGGFGDNCRATPDGSLPIPG